MFSRLAAEFIYYTTQIALLKKKKNLRQLRNKINTFKGKPHFS